MTEKAGQHSEQYREARQKFDDLKIEDKAVFLLESTVTTFARSLEEFGRAVGESLERTFEAAERRRESEPGHDEPSTPGPGNGTTASE